MRNKYLVLPIIVTLMSATTTVYGQSRDEDTSSGMDRNGKAISGKPLTQASVLKELTTDLTAKALAGQAEPITERVELLYQAEKILTNGINSFLLVGDPRTGKTLFVQKLAEKLNKFGKRLLQLNVNKLVANTMYSGQLQDKIELLKKAIIETKGQTILVIENIDLLVQTQLTQSFATELAMMALDKQVSLIGVLSPDRLATVLEKDGSPLATLQKFNFPSPTRAEVIRQLNARADYLEKKFSVEIDIDLIERIVNLTSRFQADKPLADQAYTNLTEYLALLEAQAKGDSVNDRMVDAKINELKTEQGLIEKFLGRGRATEAQQIQYQQRLIEINSEISALLESEKNFELRFIKEQIAEARLDLARLKSAAAPTKQMIYDIADLEKNRIPDLEARRQEILKNQSQNIGTIVASKDKFEIFLAEKTGLDPRLFTGDQADYFKFLEAELNRQVVGQRELIASIMGIIKRQFSGYSMKGGRTKLEMMTILGPTGVGKTEISRILAKYLVGENGYIRIDGGDLSSETGVNKLVGSNAGYVDSEKGGILSEPVRRNSFAFVFYDEMGRMVKAVRDLLYPIYDDAKAKDGLGRTVDYSNTVQMGALNVPSVDQYAIYKRYLSAEDFADYVEQEFNISKEEQKTLTKKQLDSKVGKIGLERMGWEPSFVGRQTVLVANALTLNEIRTIAENHLAGLAKDIMKESKAKLTYDATIVDALAKSGFDPEFGARPLEQAKATTIIDLLANQKYDFKITDGDEFRLSVMNNEDGRSAIIKSEVVRGGQIIGSSDMRIDFRPEPKINYKNKSAQELTNTGLKKLINAGKKMPKAKVEAGVSAKNAEDVAARRRAAIERAAKKAR